MRTKIIYLFPLDMHGANLFKQIAWATIVPQVGEFVSLKNKHGYRTSFVVKSVKHKYERFFFVNRLNCVIIELQEINSK